jgi:Chalcone isomerase-like
MMRNLAAIAAAWSLAMPPPAALVREPKTGVPFAATLGGMSLLGVGLRTKTFLKVKVYAIGLYVADSALSGPLAVHKGQEGTPAFYSDLITGDFEKQFVLKPVRDISAAQIQEGFRTHMRSADQKLLDQFVSYFAATREGEECVLRWVPGGTLETHVAGRAKPAIADRAFSQAVFAIWLGDKAVEDHVRKRLVSRAAELLRHPARR